MRIDQIEYWIEDRIRTLSLLRQPGAVDLGSYEDNSANQDDLFHELDVLEDVVALINRRMR